MSNAEGSTCSTPQRSASGEDSDSDYENENVRPRGLTGLQNLGNTCYLNSALQSLSNCPPLTRYFLDCPQLILPDKSPMLSRSYLKLITELWHKKRPSYVVPSGVVTGIKAVHPMFRGYTQQDAQEFLRCLMDQLHEELKVPYSDDSESEDEDAGGGGRDDDGSNNATSAGSAANEQKVLSVEGINRRPSFDSISSQSELDYETCDSGLSSERSSNGGRDAGSSDENNSDTNDGSRPKKVERARKSSAATSQVQDGTDCVANTKEMKETANLLEKKSESDTQGRRHSRNRPVMEGGDSREQGSTSYLSVPVKDVEAPTSPQPQQTQPLSSPSKPRKVKNTRFESIISQTFDGKILSSVRCLNCNTVSTTKETFQDLSLPIPSKDHLHMLHSGYPAAGGVVPPKGGTCGEVHQGWLAWMYSWMKSWFIGPTITLQDCLLAFFSADELKGDNMYSCEKCKKLRNGLKYSKVLQLPEILSIHLKRFRHEFYSSKISTYISFPLEGLDMEPYLYRGNISESKFHKACKDEVTLYDLVAIICHHGTAGGGHYTAYCLNHLNEQWYEFDDQYVTEVDISQVQNCEAYVLFYRKSNKAIENVRQKVMDMEHNETSILRFYISKQWMSRFNTFAEPGPITNKDFLCKHGGVPPGKVSLIYDLTEEVPQSTWELLYNRFGGGPVCNHLYTCKICHSEQEKLRLRQKMEKETFIQLNDDFQEEHTATVYAISMAWFKEWEAFVREKTDLPPGPIENSRIIVFKNAQPTLRQTSDYGQLSKDMWLFLHRIYGGGPELIIRQSAGTSVKPTSSSPTPTAAVTQPVASPPALSSSPSGSALSQNPQSSAACLPTSPVTLFETTASQTASVSSVSTSTSTHPPSSSTSRSCDSGSPISNEVRDTLERHVETDATTTAHTPALYKELEPESSSITSAHRPAPNEDVEKALDPNDDARAVSTSSAGKSHSTPSCTLQANKNEKKSLKSCTTLDKHEIKSARDSLAQPKLSLPSHKNTDPRGHSKQAQKTEAESGENVSSSKYKSADCIRQSDSSASLFKSKAASSDSLPDSGFGTDLSCNDLLSVVSETSKADVREKVSSNESLSDVTNLDLPSNTSEESSLLPNLAGSEISQESKLCPPAETASAKNAVPYVATFGKGKRRNKKGKHMDVTKI